MRFGWGVASAGLATAAAVASFLGRHGRPASPQPDLAPPPPPAAVATAIADDSDPGPSPAQLVSGIEAAQRAVAAQIGQPPYSGPIDARPDFISEFEWRVLQGVARTHADSEAELTLLVNRLRFTRLRTLWQSLRAAGNPDESRRQLARQLLDEIPGRVRAHQLDLAQAQSLQWQLLGDLVSDPVERIRRASEESLRLGGPTALQ